VSSLCKDKCVGEVYNKIRIWKKVNLKLQHETMRLSWRIMLKTIQSPPQFPTCSTLQQNFRFTRSNAYFENGYFIETNAN